MYMWSGKVKIYILPVDTKKKMQNHLDYCCVVWQECSLELQRKVESIQNYGMRLILSKPARTPSIDFSEK